MFKHCKYNEKKRNQGVYFRIKITLDNYPDVIEYCYIPFYNVEIQWIIISKSQL